MFVVFHEKIADLTKLIILLNNQKVNRFFPSFANFREKYRATVECGKTHFSAARTVISARDYHFESSFSTAAS
jgi:hypothetical protein